jgi:hypothetical protein
MQTRDEQRYKCHFVNVTGVAPRAGLEPATPRLTGGKRSVSHTCRRLLLLVASLGQEKGNVAHANERPAAAANFLALSVDPIVGHDALDVVSKLGLSAADYQKITVGNARRLMPNLR